MSKRNTIILAVIMLVSIIISAVYLFSDTPYYTTTLFRGSGDQIEFTSPSDELTQVLILPAEMSDISGIRLIVNTYERANEGTLIVELKEDNKTIYTWNEKTDYLWGGQIVALKTEKPCPIDYSKTYSVTIRDDFEKPDNNIGLALAYSDPPTSETYFNGELLLTDDLTYSVICQASSFKQRLATAAIFLCCVAIILLVVFAFIISDTDKLKRMSRVLLYTSATGMMVLFILIFDNEDGIVITNWTYQFLESFRTGQAREFAVFLKDTYKPSNYNIIDHIISAISILPLYLIELVSGTEFSIREYNVIRMIPVVISILASAFFIKKITTKWGFSEDIGDIVSLLYIMSPAMIWGNLATGQVDVYAAFLLIVSAYFAVIEKYPLTVFFAVFSSQIKQFSIFYAVIPILILLIGRIKRSEYIKCIAAALIMPLISKFLSSVVFIDYGKAQKLEQSQWGHLFRLTATTVGDNAIFILSFMLVCLWCIYKVIRKEVKSQDFLLAPMIVMFVFQALVTQNIQWFLYPVIAIVFVTLFMDDRRIPLFTYVVYSVMFYVYSMTYIPTATDNGMIEKGWLAYKLPLDTYMIYADRYLWHFVPSLTSHEIWTMSYSVLTACVIAIIYEFYRSRKKNAVYDKVKYCDKGIAEGVIFITFLMNVMALLFSVFTYMGYFII